MPSNAEAIFSLLARRPAKFNPSSKTRKLLITNWQNSPKQWFNLRMQSAGPTVERSSPVNGLLPYAAWVLALFSMAGSLFFSEVMDLPPCVLCWYQRIAMYPLVLIIGIGIVANDLRWKTYALPLALIGL